MEFLTVAIIALALLGALVFLEVRNEEGETVSIIRTAFTYVLGVVSALAYAARGIVTREKNDPPPPFGKG